MDILIGEAMEFIKGMDISFLPEMLDRGAIFSDQYGNVITREWS